jgi:hypothetical protein
MIAFSASDDVDAREMAGTGRGDGRRAEGAVVCGACVCREGAWPGPEAARPDTPTPAARLSHRPTPTTTSQSGCLMVSFELIRKMVHHRRRGTVVKFGCTQLVTSRLPHSLRHSRQPRESLARHRPDLSRRAGHRGELLIFGTSLRHPTDLLQNPTQRQPRIVQRRT